MVVPAAGVVAPVAGVVTATVPVPATKLNPSANLTLFLDVSVPAL